jgi:hypothetical protein
MKTLDDLLRAAFDAGVEHGEDIALLEERGCMGEGPSKPTFEEWRAGLSA